MSHRKWKETKQQPGTAGPGSILGYCFVSLRFLCDIHSIHSVFNSIFASAVLLFGLGNCMSGGYDTGGVAGHHHSATCDLDPGPGVKAINFPEID